MITTEQALAIAKEAGFTVRDVSEFPKTITHALNLAAAMALEDAARRVVSREHLGLLADEYREAKP